jgi:4a-hydroxytetrahydrobiopterin dehydratase
MSELSKKTCIPCEGGVLPLNKEEVAQMLTKIPGWTVDESGIKKISRLFEFKNYYHTLAFVNAVAWIAHQEDHHPDLEVGYKQCKVYYNTHAIEGLSENDFICASKVNDLLAK